MADVDNDRTTYHSKRIQRQVHTIANLSPDSAESQNRIHARLRICRESRKLEVLDEFACSKDLPDERELLLGSIEGSDGAIRSIGPVEIPGIESGKVLDGAEEFVAAD